MKLIMGGIAALAVVWVIAVIAVRILFDDLLNFPECIGQVCVYQPPLPFMNVAIAAAVITVIVVAVGVAKLYNPTN